MNPRIRELAEQAGFQYIKDEGIGWAGNHNASLPKFAELIVRECVTAITDDDLAKDCGTILMDSYAKGMRYSAEKIKEHFGVEA
jgi:hypothetical protein